MLKEADMENFLNGGIAELEQAKAAVVLDAEKAKALADAEAAGKLADSELKAKKKEVEDKIKSTIDSRRADITAAQDKFIAQASKDLKMAEKERKMAKDSAVSGRIVNETSDLAEANKRLKKENRQFLKENKLPGFCNNNLYYALFSPKRVGEILILVAAILLAVLIIPMAVYFLLDMKVLYKILIYVGIVVVFVLIYLLIHWMSKSKNPDAIHKGREKLDEIRANKKQIKKMERSIRRDKNEDQYGLEQFDADIESKKEIVKQKYSEKEAALKEFDEQTAPQIRTQIENENLQTLNELEQKASSCKIDLESRKEAAKASEAEITKTVKAFLGNKNATVEKIDELIAIINSGEAQTIMQALDIQKGANK